MASDYAAQVIETTGLIIKSMIDREQFSSIHDASVSEICAAIEKIKKSLNG